jgi:allophanate hydrolase
VALGMVSFAFGTDTAGSGRVPAGFNNIVGLKPSLGHISTRGVVPACQTLDCVSVFALTADDAGRVLDVAGAYDPAHPWSREMPAAAAINQDRFTFAVPAAAALEFFGNDDYAAGFTAACAQFESLGGQRLCFDYEPFAETAALLYGGPWVAERFHAARAIVEHKPESLMPVIRTILEGAAAYSATDTFDALYRLEDLRHRCAALWQEADIMLVPTAPTHPTIAAVEAEPITRNSELGTYTNFVNLLDLCAVAVPAARIEASGLPFGVTMIAPAGREADLLALAGQFHAATGLTLGATGHAQPPASLHPSPAPADTIRIAVCGAHLSGQPLNHQLTDRGGFLVADTTTAPVYRLFALSGGPPARPGLIRMNGGAAIRVEVWELPSATVGSFVAGIPAPLGVGRLRLADDSEVTGFLCEPYALGDATDITEYGDWRSYINASS